MMSAAMQTFTYSSKAKRCAVVLVLIVLRFGLRRLLGANNRSVNLCHWIPGTADFVNRELGDLAILDLRNYSVSRIARHVKAHWFAFSPDERYVAYTSALGFEPNTEQPIHEIALYEFDRGRSRKLVEGIQLGYEIELNWSPDSRQIAYISSGQRAKGEIVVVSVADGTTKSLAAKDLPSFSEGEGERPPLWDATGKNIYALGNDGKLWRIEVSSGRGTAVGDIPGHRITGLVARAGRPTLWTTDDRRPAWVIAREREGTKAGIFRIDLASGRSSTQLENERTNHALMSETSAGKSQPEAIPLNIRRQLPNKSHTRKSA